jgi:adenine/guanine phosphoribosyltransferase-like PRPP-binding protein
MRLNIDKRYQDVVTGFFRENPAIPHTISFDGANLAVDVEEASMERALVRRITLYFKYIDLFEWRDAGVENVVFWEHPERFDDMVKDFQLLTEDLNFQLIAPIESRGFLLAGILAGGIHVPVYPVRKFIPYFERFPGVRVEYRNWKGKDDALFIFSREQYIGKRLLIVDDLIETGSSLHAAGKGFSALGSEVVGAFYLCDVMDDERRNEFSIPIRSFVKRKGISR